MPPTRRSYTPEEKAEALRLYRDVGPHEAARLLGYPLGTICVWGHRAGVKALTEETASAATAASRAAWAARRARLAELLGEAAEEFVVRATTEDVTAKDRKDLLVACGIAIDKAQLLTGGATSRPGVPEDESAEARALRVAALRDEVAARRELRVVPPGEATGS